MKLTDKPLSVQFNWENQEPMNLITNKHIVGIKHLYSHPSFYEDRKNECAVCGSEKEFARFQTLPILYKSHLPKEVKVFTSADVILLCA